MTAARAAQEGQGGLGADKEGAGVNLLHQIEALDRSILDVGEADGAGVVHEGVEPAEGLLDGGERVGDLDLVAHIHLQRQRLPAERADLVGDGVDGPGQRGMRHGGFGGDDEVGAGAGGGERNGATDAAGRAGDEDDFSLEGLVHGKTTPCMGRSCVWRRRMCTLSVTWAATSPAASASVREKSRSILLSCSRAARIASSSCGCRRA